MPNSTIEEARDALFSEIEEISDSPPKPEEMRIAFNQIKSWYSYENDGTTSQALTLGTMEIIQNRSLGDSLIEQCLLVSPEDVQRVAKRYLTRRNRTLCTYEVNSSSTTS